jgi:hypothetical protein
MADNRQLLTDMLTKILAGKAKQKTVDQYVKNYLKAKREVGEFTPASLGKYLDAKKPSTAHQYLWGLKSVLDLNKERNAVLLEWINKRIEENKQQVKEHYKEQKKSKRESDNWMTLKQLQKYNKQQRTALSAMSDRFTKTPNHKMLRDWLMTSLYIIDPTNNPPRRADYNVKLTKSIHNAMDDKSVNHLVLINKSKKVFVFHNYKTDKAYGSQQLIVGRKLNAVINIYLKFNPDNKYLFQDKNGENISQNSCFSVFRDRQTTRSKYDKTYCY